MFGDFIIEMYCYFLFGCSLFNHFCDAKRGCHPKSGETWDQRQLRRGSTDRKKKQNLPLRGLDAFPGR